MVIDTSKKDPYTAVVDVIRELTKENGYERMFNRIVRIKTTVLGESNELLLVDDFDYVWENDWYEGGEVELLGWIDIDDVEVPVLC
jgi:hypothetical protein